MTPRHRVCVFAAAICCASALAQGQEAIPSNAEIEKILAERVAVQGPGIGMVVGVIEPSGRRVIGHGQMNATDGRAVDGNTLFEIGSLTKVFTALLLADMTTRGEVAVADPVAKHLRPNIKVPARAGRAITLADLATHTSGLPFMPEQLSDTDNVVSGSSASDMYAFLARHELRREPSSAWDYSNLGYWLLSEALASRAGMSFSELLQRRITDPLNLKSTTIGTPIMRSRLAVGHNAALQPAPMTSAIPLLSLMPAAGGVISSANDLLILLAAMMRYQSSPLEAAMDAMLTTRRPMPKGSEQALGWIILKDADGDLIAHDGGTMGYSSSVAWDPKRRVGVIILSNHVSAVSDISRHLLRPTFALAKPTRTRRTEITLEPSVLDSYVGRYESRVEGMFNITRNGDHLRIELPADWGLPPLRLRAETRDDFFVAELPLRIVFNRGTDGSMADALVYPPRGQKAVPVKRIGEKR